MLQLLLKLFGKGYINKIIGTRANVTKPIKFDTNSPYKLYSDEAFRDPKSRALIESKLEEYGPLVLSKFETSDAFLFERTKGPYSSNLLSMSCLLYTSDAADE